MSERDTDRDLAGDDALDGDGRRPDEMVRPDPFAPVGEDEARGRRDGEIDLVAEPVRYPRSPLLALLVIALVPTIGLYALQRWADDTADVYERSRDSLALLQNESTDSVPVDSVPVDSVPVDSGPATPGTDPSSGAATTGDGVNGETAADAPVGSDVPADSTVSSDAETDDDPAGVLATRILDYRRAPDTVALGVSGRRLGAEVEPVLSFLGDDSCGVVAAGDTIVAMRNADTPVIPASNQKILVAAAAIDVLGADHRFETSVAIPRVVDGVVDGDVYLIGGGDPVLGSDDMTADAELASASVRTSLDRLADAVVEAGVRRIRGTVIGDGTRYDDEFSVDEWADGIAGVEAGPYDALFVNDGRVRGRAGRAEDPNRAAAREFARLLNDRGVRVDNGWGSGVASTLVPVTATIESPPLADIVAEMLTTSDNDTAELLVKEIGLAADGDGSRTAGTRAIVAFLERAGLPTDGVVVVDGSGLATGNRLTCRLVVDLLLREGGGPVDDGLAVAGRTGTLAAEFIDSPVAGRLRAKTGTLRNDPAGEGPPAVKALSGYLDVDDAPDLVFALVVNQDGIADTTNYQALWSGLADRMVTYPSGPRLADLSPR